MSLLRESARLLKVDSCDEHMAVLPGPDGSFILIGYYKQRGRTQVAEMVECDGSRRPITLDDIQWWIDDKQAENVLATVRHIALMRLSLDEMDRASAIWGVK
jgi:hypothetical protein